MMFEDAEPRPQRGAAVLALGREDLDLYSVEELDERIALLEAEIARVRDALTAKKSKKDAADALFTFRS